MNVPPTLAARKTRDIIGQEENLEKIRQAICSQDKKCQVILIQGEGGMGKSRLVEEVLWRAGHPEWRQKRPMSVALADRLDWSRGILSCPLITSNLVDVIDIRLHAVGPFVQELRQSIRDVAHDDNDLLIFPEYDRAYDREKYLAAQGAEFGELRRAAEESTKAFITDLQRLASQKRVILVIDTVEKLSYVTSEWLIERRLLDPAVAMPNRTHQWLVNILGQALSNVTFIFAGRGKEGEHFFANIRKAVRGKQNVEMLDMTMPEFTATQTRDYFASLTQQWCEMQSEGSRFSVTRIAQNLAYVADHEERYKVLHVLTGGKPIRLALYAQLIVADRHIPRQLTMSWNEAAALQGNNEALEKVQQEIEGEFVNLLFRQPDLQARVLQTLVRCPGGLNARQLYLLLSELDTRPGSESDTSPRSIEALWDVLQEMENLYLVKRRGSWSVLGRLLDEEERPYQIFRLGLQDEIYRIYADHMKDDLQNKSDEIGVRQEISQKLHSWAEEQYKTYLKQKREYLEQDEIEFEQQLDPNNLRTLWFKPPGEDEIERRAAIRLALQLMEMERLQYALMYDPGYGFNELDVGQNFVRAQEEETEFLLQRTMWSVLHDSTLEPFMSWPLIESARLRGETGAQILRRAAVQEDASRWLKRFVLRGDLERAIQYASELERAVTLLPKETEPQQHEWHSWNHSLERAERHIWQGYAQIMASRDTGQALDIIRTELAKLEILSTHTVLETALTGAGGYLERGFRGIPEQGIASHPALKRLSRLVSMGYNILGYGAVSTGNPRQAVADYGKSLDAIRGDKGVDVHRAYVLNNLSRALSGLGWQNAHVVCWDALNLRKDLAQEVPLAFSYNTLALILDNWGRAEEARSLAAKAVAYFRRAAAPRGLGLALMQLGECLRHLASRGSFGRSSSVSEDYLLSSGEILLREARSIFDGAITEPVRLMQVNTELGALYRSRLEMATENEQLSKVKSLYQQALFYLDRAINEAGNLTLLEEEIDARMHRAKLQFRMGERDQAEQALQVMRQLLPRTYLISADGVPEDDQEQAWIFAQLGKVESLQGQIGMARFRERADIVGQGFSDAAERHWAIHKDKESQQHLATAAQGYCFALVYAQLFSPANHFIGRFLDDVYDTVKKFNRTELADFSLQVEKTYESNPSLKMTTDLQLFLKEFLGLHLREQEAGRE